MIFRSWTYNDRESVSSKPGIYILYLNSPLKKINDIDEKGILYIGETVDLKVRLKVVVKPQWIGWLKKNKDEMFNHSLPQFNKELQHLGKDGILSECTNKTINISQAKRETI